ncbi:hypothetical protein SNEBB_009910 [Seison nebaliae]|nr:hypothetical protein SNEBB_009910 [Seison nebaliae]
MIIDNPIHSDMLSALAGQVMQEDEFSINDFSENFSWADIDSESLIPTIRHPHIHSDSERQILEIGDDMKTNCFHSKEDIQYEISKQDTENEEMEENNNRKNINSRDDVINRIEPLSEQLSHIRYTILTQWWSDLRYNNFKEGTVFKGSLNTNCADKKFIEMSILKVNWDHSTMTGVFRIKHIGGDIGIRQFDGEIISTRYQFLTRKWDTDKAKDNIYWGKLLEYFKCSQQNFSELNFCEFNDVMPIIFMRWKENYIVNNYESDKKYGSNRVDLEMPLEGFYYAAYHLEKEIVGYYYQKPHGYGDQRIILKTPHSSTYRIAHSIGK